MYGFFEVGYYYRLKTLRNRTALFNSDGLMDYILDGKWHKCIKTKGNSCASFEDDKLALANGWGCWIWPMSYILDMEKSENPFIEGDQFLLEL